MNSTFSKKLSPGGGLAYALWRPSCPVIFLGVNIFIFNMVVFVAYLKVSALLSTPISAVISGQVREQMRTSGISQYRDIEDYVENGAPDFVLLTIHKIYSMILLAVENISVMQPDGTLRPVVWDTSTYREFTEIWNDMAARKAFPTADERWVVDIGAMDGVSGSMTYNYLSQGWNGLFVEPFPRHFGRMKDSFEERFGPTKRSRNQEIILENVGLDTEPGEGQLHIFDQEASKTSSSIDISRNANTGKYMPTSVVTIRKETVSTLMAKHPQVPKEFGVLSIDCEGRGDSTLRGFLELGYRPRYIISEYGRAEKVQPDNLMRDLGLMNTEYEILAQNRANFIFRRVTKSKPGSSKPLRKTKDASAKPLGKDK